MTISTLQKSVPALRSAVQESSLKLKTYDLGFFKIHDTNGNQRLDPDQDKIEFHPEESKYFQHPLKKGKLDWVKTYGKASPNAPSTDIVNFIKEVVAETTQTPLPELAHRVNMSMAMSAAHRGYIEATNRAQGRALDYDRYRGQLFNNLLYEGDYQKAYYCSIRLYLHHAEKSAREGRIPLAMQALLKSRELADHYNHFAIMGEEKINIDLPKNLRPLVSGIIEKRFTQAQAAAQKKGPEAAKKVFYYLQKAHWWSSGFQQKFNCQRAVELAIKTGEREPTWFSEDACRGDSVPEKERERKRYLPDPDIWPKRDTKRDNKRLKWRKMRNTLRFF